MTAKITPNGMDCLKWQYREGIEYPESASAAAVIVRILVPAARALWPCSSAGPPSDCSVPTAQPQLLPICPPPFSQKLHSQLKPQWREALTTPTGTALQSATLAHALAAKRSDALQVMTRKRGAKLYFEIGLETLNVTQKLEEGCAFGLSARGCGNHNRFGEKISRYLALRCLFVDG